MVILFFPVRTEQYVVPYLPALRRLSASGRRSAYHLVFFKSHTKEPKEWLANKCVLI